MPNPTTKSKFNGLDLSAVELRSERPDWSDAFIEDYLNRYDNEIVLADALDIEIDQKLEEIPTDFLDGSIPFVDATTGFVVEDNTNFKWDDSLLNLNTKGLVVADTTSDKLLATDSVTKEVESVIDLTNWIIQGSANQVIVTDTTGTVTLSTPQDIDTAADVDFNSLDLIVDLDVPTITNTLGDLNINAAALQDIIVKLGKSDNTSSILFKNSTDATRADMSDGGIFTVVTLRTPQLTSIVGLLIQAEDDIILRLGENAGATKISIENDTPTEVASINSLGDADFNKLSGSTKWGDNVPVGGQFVNWTVEAFEHELFPGFFVRFPLLVPIGAGLTPTVGAVKDIFYIHSSGGPDPSLFFSNNLIGKSIAFVMNDSTGAFTVTSDTLAGTEWIDDFNITGELQNTKGRIIPPTYVVFGESPYAILVTSHEVFLDTDGGAITATLPVGVDGQHYRIVNVGTSGNAVTLNDNGASLVTTLFDDDAVILTYSDDMTGWF